MFFREKEVFLVPLKIDVVNVVVVCIHVVVLKVVVVITCATCGRSCGSTPGMFESISNPESESDFPVPLSFGATRPLLVIPFFRAATAKTGAKSGAKALTTEAGDGERITPSSSNL